jgi:aryl-alcohol dehydrogenase-like predicted oxidoreductase
MEKVKLGNATESISKMGLGTMFFGTKLDIETSFSILDYYLDRGGSFIDTANKYASWVPGFKGGESENLLGEWIRARKNRDRLFITSKVGFPYEDIGRSLKKDIIFRECDRSLKRMGIETIDLYFAHAYDADTPIEESMDAFHTLVDQGKVRYIGASNFPAWRLAQANAYSYSMEKPGFCCLQQRHTVLEPSLRSRFGNQELISPEVEDYCSSYNITMIAYSALIKGAYTKKDAEMPEQYLTDKNKSRLEILARLAKETGYTVNQLVLAWMLNSDPQVLPLISGSSVEQIEENLLALEINLDREQMELLD